MFLFRYLNSYLRQLSMIYKTSFKKYWVCLFFLFPFFLSHAQKLNLTDTTDNLIAYIKFRGSLDSNKEVVFYNEGFVYAMIPEQPVKKIFKYQFFNIARFVPNDSGYTQLTKELLLYEDPATGEIINRWYNPFIKDTVDVIPIINDPVNQILKKGKLYINHNMAENGDLCFYIDLPVFYPSPLPKKDWPQNSRSDMYQSSEFFKFFVHQKDIDKKGKQSIPCSVSWNRVCDFLPWMNMSDKPGYILFSGQGWKLKNGWNDLPQNVKDFVTVNAPAFEHAPSVYTSPNMTSWRYFKKLHEQKN